MAKRFLYQGKPISVGDVVRVHTKLIEGGKERIQIFEGLVLAIKGSADQQSFKVRKIAAGNVGVERSFPVGSPWVVRIEVKNAGGDVKRAKLYYLRALGSR